VPITIHPTAIVSPKAEIGENCSIGPYSIIYDHVTLGANTVIQAFCEIGYMRDDLEDARLTIGANSLVRSHSVFYQGSTFGEHLQTGHHVIVREQSQIGRYVAIGTLCDIQGQCQLGDCVHLHSKVFVAQLSYIGPFVWIFPSCVLTNDPHPPSYGVKGVHIENYAIVASMSTILPGVRVGAEAVIGAMSLVNRNVPPRQLAFGVPARVWGDIEQRMDAEGKAVYPWFPNLKKRYPAEAMAVWESYLQAREGQRSDAQQ